MQDVPKKSKKGTSSTLYSSYSSLPEHEYEFIPMYMLEQRRLAISDDQNPQDHSGLPVDSIFPQMDELIYEVYDTDSCVEKDTV